MRTRKRWLAGALVAAGWLVALSGMALAAPANGSGTQPQGPPPPNIIAILLEPFISFLSWVLEAIGLTPVEKLVAPTNVQVALHAPWSDSTGMLAVFSQAEYQAAFGLHAFFLALFFGALLPFHVAKTGWDLARSDDPQRRVDAISLLERLLIGSLMAVGSWMFLKMLFNLTLVLSQSIASGKDLERLSEIHNWFGLPSFAAAVFGLVELVVRFAFNLTYVLRSFALLVLVATAPLAVYFWLFDNTRQLASTWLREVISQLSIQPIDALLLSVYMLAYGRGGSAVAGFLFLLIWQPARNLIRNVFSPAPGNNFTGMGIASMLMGGLGMFAFARGVFGALRGGMGFGRGGLFSPALRAGLAGGASLGDLADAGVFMGDAGPMVPSTPGAGIASNPYGMAPSSGLANPYATSGMGLQRVHRAIGIGRRVAGVAGRMVGAALGAGLVHTTGDMGLGDATTLATEGVAKGVGGLTAGSASLMNAAMQRSGGARAVAGAAVSGAKQAMEKASGGPGSTPVIGSAAVGLAALYGGMVGAARQLSSGLGELLSEGVEATAPHEASEKKVFHGLELAGYAVGGRFGAAAGRSGAVSAINYARARQQRARIGQVLHHVQPQEGDVVELRGFANRTEVWLRQAGANDFQRVEIVPTGVPGASETRPMVERYVFAQNAYQPVEGDLQGSVTPAPPTPVPRQRYRLRR